MAPPAPREGPGPDSAAPRTPSHLWHPLLACLALAVATSAAFRPALGGSATFWLLVSVPTLALSVYAGGVLFRAGRLRQLLTPKPGDLTVGALVGAGLLAVSWGVRDLLMGGSGTPQNWLYLLFVTLGDPRTVQDSLGLTSLLLVVVFAEEIVFRGWVQERLDERFGHRCGFSLAAVLFALTLSPTLATLRAPGGIPNPILFLAGLGSALCFGLCRKVTGRLVPGFFAHAIFTYFSVAQFRSPGL